MKPCFSEQITYLSIYLPACYVGTENEIRKLNYHFRIRSGSHSDIRELDESVDPPLKYERKSNYFLLISLV